MTYSKRQSCWLLSLVASAAFLAASGCSAIPGIGDRASLPTVPDALAANQGPAVPQPQSFASTPRGRYPSQPATYGKKSPWSGIVGPSGSC